MMYESNVFSTGRKLADRNHAADNSNARACSTQCIRNLWGDQL